MSRNAKINIGLVGGRGYGKTVFLTKLIQLADCSDDGFIQFDAGSETLQIKNQMLENDGILPATQIKEFSRYNFVLGKQSGEKYRVQFCDYAGELLERIDASNSSESQKSTSASNANENESNYIDDFVSNEANKPHIRKVKKWLKKCDALIVLMPADITDQKKYKPSEIKLYRQNVGVLIKTMQDDNLLKDRPVCLTINKWDLIDTKKDFDEIIQSDPFASFRQQLKNMCGKNLFCMQISAFGKHLEKDPDKAAPDGIPVNVSELLIRLVEKAEYSKIKSIKNRLESMSTSMKWLMYYLGYLLWYIRHVGATNPRLVRLSSLLYKKYFKEFAYRLASFVIVILAVSFLTGASNCLFHYKMCEKKMDSLNSPQTVSETETMVDKRSIFDYLFKERKKRIQTEFKNKKAEYNKSILQKAKAKKEGLKIGSEEWYDIAADERIKKIDEAIEEIERIRKSLTADAVEDMEIGDMIADLETEKEHTGGNNKVLDDAYSEWKKIADDCEKANKAFDFIQKYTPDTYHERRDRIESVKKEKNRIEEMRFQALLRRFQEDENYFNGVGSDTTDYLGRKAKASERIQEIRAELNLIKTTCKKDEMLALIRGEEARIEYLEDYGPFDEQVRKYLDYTINTNDSPVKPIQEFVENKIGKYKEKRQESFKKLDAKIEELNKSIYDALVEELKAPHWDNVNELDYEQKIVNTEKKRGLIAKAISIMTDEKRIEMCKELDQKEYTNGTELALYGPFNKALNDLNDNDANAIDVFLHDYENTFKDKRQDVFIRLNERKLALVDASIKELSERRKKIIPGADWKKNIGILTEDIELISSYQKTMPENTEQWSLCKRLIESDKDKIKEFEHDAPFEDAYRDLIKKDHGKGYIREIETFLIDFEKTYPNKKSEIDNLKTTISTMEDSLYSELIKEEVTDQNNWKDQVARLTKQRKEIESNIDYFSNNSDYRERLQKKEEEISREVEKLSLYGPFEDDMEKLDESVYASLPKDAIHQINAFLDAHNPLKYPDKKDDITKIQGQLKAFEGEVYSSYLEDTSNEFILDDDALPWDARLLRARSRIQLGNDILKILPTKSEHIQKINQDIEADNKLVTEIERYSEYYEAFDAVMRKSKWEQIPAINDFIMDYQHKYPNPQPKYAVSELNKTKEELLKSFNSDLETAINNNSDDDSSEDYDDRIAKAKKRIDALNSYINNTAATDKSDEIENERAKLDNLQQNKEFSRDYLALKNLSDDSDSRELFSNIYVFYNTYPEEKWIVKRINDYQSIKDIEKKRIQAITDSISNEISDIDNTLPENPSYTDVLNSCEKKQRVITEKRNQYLEHMSAYKQLTRQLEQLSLDIRDYQVLCEEEKEISRLLEESEKISEDRNSISVFLRDNEAFEKKYPDAKKDSRLIQYADLSNKVSLWNKVLFDKMEDELSPLNNDLKQQSSADDKNGIYERMFEIYADYLLCFSTNSPFFQQACLSRDRISKESDTIKNEIKLRETIDTVMAVLNDQFQGAQAKLDAIERFMYNANIFGELQNDPRYKPSFDHIKSMKESIEWENKWRETAKRAEELINNPPDGADVDKIRAYVTDCERSTSELYQYYNYKSTIQRTRELNESLTNRKRENEIILKAYESFRYAEQVANNYLSSNQEADLNSFRSAYKAFFDSIPYSGSGNPFVDSYKSQINSLNEKVISHSRINERNASERIIAQNEEKEYNHVKELQISYTKKPSQQTYNSYLSSYNQYVFNFNSTQEISDYSIRQSIQKHKDELTGNHLYLAQCQDALTKLDTSFRDFKSSPGIGTFNSFSTNAGQCNKLEIKNHPQLNYYNELVWWISSGGIVNVKLIDFDFRNSGFQSDRWAVDFNSSVYSDSHKDDIIDFDSEGIDGSLSFRNNPGSDYLANHLSKNQSIQQQMRVALSDSIYIKFKNSSGRNNKGSDSVRFYVILIEAMDRGGEYTHTFSSLAENHPKGQPGYVYLKFSGLPSYKY